MNRFRWLAIVGLLAGLVVAAGLGGVAVAQPEDQKLTGPSASSLGSSVDVDGDTLVVGSRTEGPGAVYVYERQGGSWVQTQRLSPAPSQSRFGGVVAIRGDWLAVGAIGRAPNVEGAVYLFERVAGEFEFRQRLDPELVTATPGTTLFGTDIDLDDDTLLVGASNTQVPAGFRAGALYVYERTASTWAQTQRIDGTTEGESFGRAVAVDGAFAVVGAPTWGIAGTFNNRGRIVAFDGSSGSLVQTGEVLGEVLSPAGEVGHSIDVAGTVVVATAQRRVHVFDGFGLAPVADIEPPETVVGPISGGCCFGVDIAGDRAAVGASINDANGIVNSGSVFLIADDGTGSWGIDEEFTADDGAAFAEFGRAVSLTDTDLVVGAPPVDSVYIFDTGGGGPGPYATQVLADGPVAYWRLGESAGPVLVDELGAHDGVVVADVEFGLDALIDDPFNTALRVGPQTGPTHAAEFDTAQGPGTLLPGDELTVEYWVDDVTDLASGNTIGTADATGSFAGGWDVFVNGDSGNLVVSVFESAGSSATVSWVPGLPGQGPYHIVVTRDLSELRLYVNGVVVDSVASSGAPIFYDFTGAGQVQLGPANGQVIDELAIYDTALTPAQIAAHYATGVDSTGGGGGPSLVVTTQDTTVYRGTEFGLLAIAPVPGVSVGFEVVSGPNAGVPGSCRSLFGQSQVLAATCDTDVLNTVVWGYSATVGSGFDLVRVWIDSDGNDEFDEGETNEVITVRWFEFIDYVALGDSFSAGEGLEPYLNECHRDLRAYPGTFGPDWYRGRPIADVALDPSTTGDSGSFNFFACSGATSNNVRDDADSFTQFDEPLQINNSEINADTDLVTITIGGNDAEFADILTRCALQRCTIGAFSEFRQSVEERIDRVGDELFLTYNQIRAQAPNASIWVLGYPQLFPEGIVQQLCGPLLAWAPEVQDWMRARTTQMNQVIDAATTDSGVFFVDVEQRFAGHAVCNSDEWINGIVADFGLDIGWRHVWLRLPAGTEPASFHPKAVGHRLGYDAELSLQLRLVLDGDPGVNEAGLPDNPAPGGAAATAAASAPFASTNSWGTLGVEGPVTAPCGLPSMFQPGDVVTVTGTGYLPGTDVAVSFEAAAAGLASTPLVTLTVDAAGEIAGDVTLLAGPEPSLAGGLLAAGTGDHGEVRDLVGLISLVDRASPCLGPDSAATTLDTAVVIDVFANDIANADAMDPAVLTVTDAPTLGTATVDGVTGSITYTPDAGVFGTETFTYLGCTTNQLCGLVPVTVTIDPGCTISGTPGDDLIIGTSGDDVICAGAGQDVVFGGDGDDIILGEWGNDSLYGGNGNDTLYGAEGLDVLAGEAGVDVVDDGGDAINVGFEDDTDTVGPTITITTPVDGADYAVDEAVTAAYTCDDPGGVQLCDGDVAVGDAVDTSVAGTFSFNVVAKDWAGNETSAAVTYTVTAADGPPVAADDATMIEAGDNIEIDVLANDTDPNDNIDDSTLAIVAEPTVGTAVVVDTGGGFVIAYTAPLDTEGDDPFTYEICDDTGLCDTATVTVTIVDPGSCTITGTSGPDVLTGTAGDDVICGRGGADTINAGAGNDIIFGGRGADTINAGDGDDMVFGGRGADTINAGDGADMVSGGRGGDVIDGGPGDDVLWGRRGTDTINGGTGGDEIRGGRHADTLDGGDGDDLMFGGRGADVINGGTGNDEIRGNKANDTINAGAGDDSVWGGRGADIINGGAGDDVLRGRRGADTIDGGSGDDVVRGGRGADGLDGGPGTDTCVGGAGVDTAVACETVTGVP